ARARRRGDAALRRTLRRARRGDGDLRARRRGRYRALMREPLTRRRLVECGAAVGAVAALGQLRSVPTALGALSADPRIRELRRLVRGPVVSPASAYYASLRRGYNAHFNGVHPLAVVQPLDDADVQAVVRWAVKRKVRIVARSGGH